MCRGRPGRFGSPNSHRLPGTICAEAAAPARQPARALDRNFPDLGGRVIRPHRVIQSMARRGMRILIRNRMRSAAKDGAPGLGALAVLIWIAVSSAVHAEPARVQFEIPAQPLATALLTFGRQAHISIAAPSSLIAERSAKAVRGAYTVPAALDRMLDGSGLRYEFVGHGAVRILAPAGLSSPLRTLPKAGAPAPTAPAI
jgi:hypothetical protein